MVEKAAHFSFTSEVKPSIFQIVAQNSLNNTLQPAFQKIIELLAESNLDYFGWLSKYHHEAFLLFKTILEYYYLKNYDASFSEYFYGLRRVSIKNRPLSSKDRYLCLFLLAILPYIKRKLDEKLNMYKLENAEGLLTNNWKSKCKKALLHGESGIEATWTVWLLLNYLRYMADQTESQNPNLQMLKLKLVYSSEPEDVLLFWTSLFKRKLSLKEFGVGIVQNGFRTFFEVGAFFVQFLQVWYREKPNYSLTALPTVPPPQPDPNASTYKGKCPICLQPWKIPTVVAISGYVFCFSCIVKHLREEERCPVTNYPAKSIDLVRLYD